ncbi:MAG: site-specific integrase [Acidimicrobiia bacterium]|nr:site-specific integrase [Acidimicrobiia bacterium]
MASIDIVTVDGRRLPAGSKAPKGSRYRARWRTPAGASRTRTFERKVDAEQFLLSAEHAKSLGAYVDRAAGDVTVRAFGERWIETRRGRDGAPLRARTRGLYRQLFAGHVVSTLGHFRLRDVTPAAVRQWHNGLTGSTAPAKAYRLLRAMMATAVEDELILRNPCRVAGAGVERAPERPLPTRDEVWQLANAIDARFRALVLTASFVGLRWGELVGLRRRDVDLAERIVHVARQLVEVDGVLVDGPPKTAAGVRSVAIPLMLVGELEHHFEQFVGVDLDALVFVGAKGAVLRRSNFNKVWSRARDEAGRPDLHLHDLRHYANTLAASAGASTRELMSRLGHTSPAAALRYQHATAERDRVIAERMDDLIAGRSERPTLRVLKGAG